MSADEIRKIEQQCNSFEAALKDATAPRIEEFLENTAESLRSSLLRELLVLEVASFREHDERPLRSTYHERFPNHVGVVDEAFRATLYMSPIASLDIGERAGPYIVEEQISSGGFGIVFRATHSGTHDEVAIKYPQAAAFREKHDVARFEQEIVSLRRLKHKNIVTVLDDGVTDAGTPYLVMPLLEGKTLVEWAQTERPPLKTRMKVLTQIARAMAYVHRHGFVHRDLNAKNIIVLPDSTPVVTDFGLAVHDEAQQAHRGEQAGSWAFMSPEQVRGEAHHIDGRADIWALGVIMYYLLTDKRPFNNTNHGALTEEILKRSPKPPRQHRSAIPRQLELACNRCLEKHVSDRYSTADDLADEIRTWLAMKKWRVRLGLVAAVCITAVFAFTWKHFSNSSVGHTQATPKASSQVQLYLPTADTVAVTRAGFDPRPGEAKTIAVGTPSSGEENAMLLRFPLPEIDKLEAAYLRFEPTWCSDTSMAGQIRLVHDSDWDERTRVRLSEVQHYEETVHFSFDGPKATRIDISKLFTNPNNSVSKTMCLSIHANETTPIHSARIGSRENSPKLRPTLEIAGDVSNSPPTAKDDSYFVAANTPLLIDALSGICLNDEDSDNNCLNVDVNLSPEEYPKDGNLTLHPGGSFRYDPDHGFRGLDEFRYRVTDGFLNSSTATVRLIVGESTDVIEHPVQATQLNEKPAASSGEIARLHVGLNEDTKGRSCALMKFKLPDRDTPIASAVLRLNCINKTKDKIKHTLKVLWRIPWDKSTATWHSVPFQFAEHAADIAVENSSGLQQFELDVSPIIRECRRNFDEDEQLVTFVIEASEVLGCVDYIGKNTKDAIGPTLVLTVPKRDER